MTLAPRALLALASALLLAGSAGAVDTVVLKSGSMMEGKVENMDANWLQLSFEGGLTNLRRDQLASVWFDKNATDVRTALTPPATTPGPGTPPPPPPPTIPGQNYGPAPAVDNLGQWAGAGDLRIRVVAVKFGRAKVRQWFGGVADSDRALVVDLEVQNASSQRVLPYRTEMGTTPFNVYDDAGRAMRPVSLGFGESLVGELPANADIQPGAVVSHRMIFQRPNPQTQHVIITVPGSAFGQTGDIQMKVLNSSIQK